MSTPHFLRSLGASERKTLENVMTPVAFPKGTCIFREGSAGDGCYWIDAGEVRLEIERPETDTEAVLGYIDAGKFLGELSVLDGQPRSATAYAHTDVAARRLSAETFAQLLASDPALGIALLEAFSTDVAAKLRQSNQRMSDYLFVDQIDPDVNAMVARAVEAQRVVSDWPEPAIDALLRDIAETVAAHAEELAVATVAETGLGRVPDKTLKNRFASLDVYRSLAGKPAAGVLRVDTERHIIEIASPVGVVLGLIPMTNPVATVVFKALISLKGRNALILSCHRSALKVGNQTTELIRGVLQRHQMSVDMIQCIRNRVSRKTTSMFMRHPDVAFILATGGVGMVKAAYSSGTPAIGVGPGNAPAWVCADADPDAAAQLIMESKTFDNGVICGSEHHIVVDASVREAFSAALERHGAAVLTPAEAEHFTAHAFDPVDGKLQRQFIGQGAEAIAQATGIVRDAPIGLIVVPVEVAAISGPYGREKLAPVLSLFTVAGEAEGIRVCQQLLAREGLGHTAIIHSTHRDLIERFGTALPASRILVNAPGSQGCIGIGNGLLPSLTLGCGTFGGTSTTDNVSYTHLLNVKRIAYHAEPVPTG